MPQADDRATRTTRQRESKPAEPRTSTGTRRRAPSSARDRAQDAEPDAPRRTPRRPSPAQIARAAAEQLVEIMGAQPTSISGLERVDAGWLVQVEVVELARIPDSTSVMASYHVVVDDEGSLQSYRRDRRYYRNQAGDA